MSLQKLLLAFFTLFYTSTLFAGGLGLYMLNIIDENSYYDYEETGKDYGYSPGVGLTYDINLGKNNLFSYRVGIDYYKASGTSSYYDYDLNGTQSPLKKRSIEKSTMTLVNTFGFGIYRTKHLRLWLGPQVNIMKVKETNDYNDYFVDFSAGPVAGINYNINNDFSLAVDASLMVVGDTTSSQIRVYAFWRFDENFIRPAPKLKKRANHNSDMGDKLRYLESLRDEGILTEEEFQKKRQEVIAEF